MDVPTLPFGYDHAHQYERFRTLNYAGRNNRTKDCATPLHGAMKRMNLRDVPDEVYLALAQGAQACRQSLNAYVVDRITEVAQTIAIADYVSSYQPPAGTGITLDDAVAAVRAVREAS